MKLFANPKSIEVPLTETGYPLGRLVPRQRRSPPVTEIRCYSAVAYRTNILALPVFRYSTCRHCGLRSSQPMDRRPQQSESHAADRESASLYELTAGHQYSAAHQWNFYSAFSRRHGAVFEIQRVSCRHPSGFHFVASPADARRRARRIYAAAADRHTIW